MIKSLLYLSFDFLNPADHNDPGALFEIMKENKLSKTDEKMHPVFPTASKSLPIIF